MFLLFGCLFNASADGIQLGLDRAGTTHITLDLHLAVGQVASITLRSKMVSSQNDPK
jgi:hypothetical protein